MLTTTGKIQAGVKKFCCSSSDFAEMPLQVNSCLCCSLLTGCIFTGILSMVSFYNIVTIHRGFNNQNILQEVDLQCHLLRQSGEKLKFWSIYSEVVAQLNTQKFCWHKCWRGFPPIFQFFSLKYILWRKSPKCFVQIFLFWFLCSTFCAFKTMWQPWKGLFKNWKAPSHVSKPGQPSL